MLATAGFLAALVSSQGNRPIDVVLTAPTRATAVRASQSPVVDGRDDDDVWRSATAITDFVEFEPNEGKAPRFRTEARVAYDHRNFYVFVRAYDDEPHKITRLLARRDVRPPTDQIKIIIDSYFDKRSGYEFAVSPSGVKRDFLVSNDGQEDQAWDGVWDVATTVDSLGWTAEFRIPLSQLRYASAPTHTFGFGVWRDIERYKERVSWPVYKRTAPGLMSQIGELHGIAGLSAPRRLEVSPYVVTTNVTVADGGDFTHEQRLSGGADFKYGLTSNLTLDGTINPDFGQVEADPAVLNLGAFETFFQERRPFFLEGAGLFRFSVNCFAVNDCGRDMLFYSRRIGRAPQLGGVYRDDANATTTTIVGAGKLTGRLPSGLSLGVLDAHTEPEEDPSGRTIEPATNYAVVRANQDLRDGETGIGAIGTFVHRSNDRWTEDFLRSSAVVGGVELRHRFLNRRFQLNAQLIGSRVTGTEDAIAATQRSSVHGYQRPDGAERFDPARTALSGSSQQVRFGKVGGGMLRFETSYQRMSAGFEANDVGFLGRADKQTQATWAQLAFNKPTRLFRRAFWNFNEWLEWTAAGLSLDRAVNTNLHAELPNTWWVHGGITVGGLGDTYCDRCARGGPALRTDNSVSAWGGVEPDYRRMLRPSVWFNYFGGDGGRSEYVSVSPSLGVRMSGNVNLSMGANIERNRDDRQWYDNITDDEGVTHYTFAHLSQRTLSLTSRIDYTASPTLTFQLYAQPFITKGTYSNLRELADPRAEAYDARYQPYTAISDAGGFNVKQFRSNLVARWEYRPGSAVFVVWQQGRGGVEDGQGTRSWRGELDELFRLHPDNTFLIKFSYWLDR